MRDQRVTDGDGERLSDRTASRVLSRAVELDAALRAGVSVAELRAAAVEAGIATDAFDAALTEVREQGQPPAVQAIPEPRRRIRPWLLSIVAAAMLAGALVTTRAVAPVTAGPTIEEQFLLRCASPAGAAELIRPLVGRDGAVGISGADARVLNVRATPPQMDAVRSLLERYESGSGSPTSCTVPPRGGVTR